MLADFEDLVQRLVRDDAGKLDQAADVDPAIANAVTRYSKDRPQTKVEDLTPADANTLPLPNAWEQHFSAIASLEYPIGQNPRITIESGRWWLYQDPAAITIKLADAVDTTQKVRASFSIAHVVSAAQDTVPLGDREPVACWAAADLCDQLAALYSGGTDSTIQADSVRQQSKSQEYAARAKALRKRYTDELGIDDKRNEAASAVVTVTDRDSRGQPRITHGAEYRNSRQY